MEGWKWVEYARICINSRIFGGFLESLKALRFQFGGVGHFFSEGEFYDLFVFVFPLLVLLLFPLFAPLAFVL